MRCLRTAAGIALAGPFTSEASEGLPGPLEEDIGVSVDGREATIRVFVESIEGENETAEEVEEEINGTFSGVVSY